MAEEEHDMTSLRSRRKKSSVGISCCFNGSTTTTKHHRRASLDAAPSSFHPSPRLSSPSAWFKSNKTNGGNLPEIRGKCRNFFTSRIARHRRHSSAEFSYDPLSYALNFDEDPPSPHHEYFPTARFPISPPMRSTAPFDHHHHHLPVSRSPPSTYHTTSNKATVAINDDLRRGFEALSINMRGPQAEIKMAGQRRNKAELSSPCLAVVAEVRRSLEGEEVTSSPAGINSSNREILVQLG